METNYDIEFDITSILNQILYGGNRETNATTEPESESRSGSVSGSVSGSDPHVSDISGTWISMMHTSQSIIDNLIYSYNNQMQRYNQNMERYNQNIERIIQLLVSFQTQIHQRTAATPSIDRGSTTSTTFNQRRNALRNEGSLIRLLLNTSNYGTNRNTANMLYAYLYPNLQNRNTFSRELSTPVQRANAIQTITYTPEMRSTVDTICPISLLSFQDGEQVSQIRYCLHIFKTEYLNNWLTNYSSCCPVCRYDIRSYRNINQHNMNTETNESETDE